MTPGNSTQQRSTTSDHFEELAALFLTEADETNVPVRARWPGEASFRELLIVGNLPVRGGVWLTPYADAIAREHGPTALVRLDLAPPTLELLRTPIAAESIAGEHAGLKEAIAKTAPSVSVWIVRGPAHRTHGDFARFDFDRITILTGADTMAAEAACGIVREIVEAAAISAEDGPIDLPQIALAVVGSGVEAANEIVERVNQSVAKRFGIEVSLAMCVPRMDAGIKCASFAPFGVEEEPTVRELLEWIDGAEGVGGDAWTKHDGPRLRLAAVEEMRGEREPSEPVNGTVAAPKPADPAPEITTVASAAGQRRPASPLRAAYSGPAPFDEGVRKTPSPPVSGIKIAPKPARTAETAVVPPPAPGIEINLASFAGLTALPVRCPLHTEVELAADERGNVHVLARESSLRDLHAVESWVQTHREILALACGNRMIKPSGEVVCHVFTNEPATLADLHGTNLRLHVLAPVTVGGQTTWYSAPLSR